MYRLDESETSRALYASEFICYLYQQSDHQQTLISEHLVASPFTLILSRPPFFWLSIITPYLRCCDESSVFKQEWQSRKWCMNSEPLLLLTYNITAQVYFSQQAKNRGPTGNVLVVLTGNPRPKPPRKMTGLNKTVKEPENTDAITSAVGCSQSPHCFEGRSDHSLHTAEKSNKTCHYYTLSLDLIMACDLCHVLWHQTFCYSPHKSVEGPEISTLLQPLWINPKRR